MADNELWKAFVLTKVDTSAHLNFAKLAKGENNQDRRVKEVYGVFGRYDS